MDQDVWIDGLLGGLTLEQKVGLLAGADTWRTVALPDAGVPSLTLTDGPNGVRGAGDPDLRSTSFPCGTALGATWDPALVGQVGAALAAEGRAIGAHVLLGPTVNLHRSPLAGRNFECYSEDPLLSAELAVGFVRGVQGAGLGACVKHLVANDSEFERMTISSEVDERTLRELYLLPFERTVAEARPWAVMGAYNRVNGTYACAHRELLIDVLKDEWGFDGVVVSDWGAVHETEGAANGGTDLEMPGPARYFGAQLVAAVESGTVDPEVIDDKVRRLLRLVDRTGARDPGTRADLGAEPSRTRHRELARRAAVAGIVLLRNEGGLLPFDAGAGPDRPVPWPAALDDHAPASGPAVPADRWRLAVVGPNAAAGAFQGGGSSAVSPERVVHPLDAIVERAGAAGVAVLHEPGVVAERYVPEPERDWFEPLDEQGRGLLVEYFDADEPDGEPVRTRIVPRASWTWWDPPSGVTGPGFAARWTGRLRPPTSGSWRFGVAAVGRARLFVDDVEVVDNWTAPTPGGSLLYGSGSEEVAADVGLEAGRAYEVRIELSRWADSGPTALRVGIAPGPPADALERAVTAAAGADAAVVVVGTGPDWEGEGFDRSSMALPGGQDELVRRVAAVNPRTVVVVNTGAPVEMPWADDVAAVVQLFFAGQEIGPALAGVLFGDEEPAGRLPTTFPFAYRDHPALFGYPGESGRVGYGEGVFMGYRGYQARGLEPRFPFGHGLSYSTFDHGDLEVVVVADTAELAGPHPAVAASRPPAVAEARIEVTNTGTRPGVEVVQLFVGAPAGRLARPPLELKAFAKVALDPGERRTVVLALDARAFAAYDPQLPGWRCERGRHRIVAASAGRPVREAPVELVAPVVLPVR